MKKYRHETVAGIFVFVGLLCVGYMAIKLGKFTPFGDHTYVLYARFTSVSGLRVGNPVEMFGIQIGEVKDLKMDQKDQLALVALRIDKGIRIYGDANAAIKTEGLIGDQYVSIDPGGAAPLLKPGETITQTEPPVNIGDLIGKYIFGGVKKD
jgi:phospholipid/cholesterol/gamma-HCH transport system substrate-binding protein